MFPFIFNRCFDCDKPLTSPPKPKFHSQTFKFEFEAHRDNFDFRGNLSYFSLFLADSLTMTNFLHYPQTFKWTKCLTSNMFSEAPLDQIKKVVIFALWFGMNWYGFALFLHADVVWWIEVLQVEAIKM